MPHPVIALTASSKAAAHAGKYPRVRLNEAYVRAIQSAGLIPLIVPPSLDEVAARDIIATVAGLALTGGEDVDPTLYGAERHPLTQASHAARDATELALARAARDAALPVLGICRGLQLLNVALGGTLTQDLGAERPSEIAHAREKARTQRVHEVFVDADTRLASAVGERHLRVNTLHHQAVDRVAADLVATAFAPDGVVEAAESRGDWWALAVQWHPEELLDTPEPWDRRIFEAFAQACRRQ